MNNGIHLVSRKKWDRTLSQAEHILHIRHYVSLFIPSNVIRSSSFQMEKRNLLKMWKDKACSLPLLVSCFSHESALFQEIKCFPFRVRWMSPSKAQKTQDCVPRHTALKVKHLGYFTFPQELDNNQHKETIQAKVRFCIHQTPSHHRTVLETGGNLLSPDRVQHLHSPCESDYHL